MEYVRGSESDKWHWCKNCTQYPMYVYQKTTVRPPSEFCEQCKTKEENRNCICEEGSKMYEVQLRREHSEFCYNAM